MREVKSKYWMSKLWRKPPANITGPSSRTTNNCWGTMTKVRPDGGYPDT
jgi:hypothetical protein